MALRVLCAPEEDARGWSSIADALQLPPPVVDAASGGAACGSDGEEDEHGQPDLGAVQVWRVLGEDGQLEAAAAGEAAACSTGEQQSQGYAALLNCGMCRLLRQAVERRQGTYAGSLEDDLQLLEQQQAAGNDSAAGAATGDDPAAAEEQQVAERAALVLRITEKEVLRDLLTAVDRCLAALPAEEQEEQEQKAAGKQQAKQQRGTKRKAATAPAKAAAGKQRQQRGSKGKRS